MEISKEDFKKLKELEESLWLSETRFDKEYMNKILSSTFFEFGRSGKIYKRDETIDASPQKINAAIPLKNFQIHPVNDDVVIVTYISEVTNDELEAGNRSSVWLRTSAGWKLQFHQGTPC